MKNEKQLDCPFCGKEGHLYYNPSKRVFYCFRCGAKGTASTLERAGYRVLRGQPSILERDLSYRLVEGLEDPPDYVRLSESSRHYLLERGIHTTILKLLEKKIYDTDEGILFFFPDEEYWQVRRWQPFCPPRWKNPSIAPKSAGSGVTYHLRTHYESSRVCCVEGIGDALRVAPYANVAALLSSNPHESQLFSLLERGYNRITFLFDEDVEVSKRINAVAKAGAIFDSADQFDCQAPDPGSADDTRLEEV